jgi:DNA-binding response OmpR family regulator
MIKVLVVEDNEIECDLYRENLNKSGFEVIVLSDPTQALDYVKENNPDLVILDIEMPEINGFDLARMIKKQFDTPIMFVSGHDDPESVITAIALGAETYVTKPIIYSELFSAMQEHGMVNMITRTLNPAINELTRIKNKYCECDRRKNESHQN